jgi:hypothetical protein
LFCFLLSVSFHHGSSHSYIIWGMKNRPIGGYSLETWSHPIDMNNNPSVWSNRYVHLFVSCALECSLFL